ncbi:MAG: F0F1 ATP synthase subunit alpha [Candidatus Omnitrophota bacterium]
MWDTKEIGTVEDVRESIVVVSGLASCMSGQIIDFKDGAKGMIIGFNENESSVLIFTDKERVEPKDKVVSKLQNFMVPVGQNFLGRIINALGEPLDKKGAIEEENFYPVFKEAAAILDREIIEELLETGIKIIDSVIPIGKGQRELIIGNRITGKTSLTTDVILNQKGKDVICVYCCIGKSLFDVGRTIQLLEESGALNYTIVLLAGAQASVGEQYLAPYTAASVGEYFMRQGKDVLVVFDDLTNHARTYREISLLLERYPGRDAYPGDIFYIHSQLMEKAGKLKAKLGAGSMTFLPIVETLEGDVTGYIPSNLISMTDGQIYLNSALFNEGFRPAVDLKLSVSRIGNKVQSPIMRELTAKLRLEYIQYLELRRLTKIKAGMSEEIENKLKRGEAIEHLFIQDKNKPVSLAGQIILLYALKRGLLDDLNKMVLGKVKNEIFDFTLKYNPDLIKKITQKTYLDENIEKGLVDITEQFFLKEKI